MKRYLILEDGSHYEGIGFGADNFKIGELVFNTSMTGYQEVLSDLSYCGQITVMTYPLIGNYGINRDDFESLNPAIFGLIVKEACKNPNNFRNAETIDEFLKLKNIWVVILFCFTIRINFNLIFFTKSQASIKNAGFSLFIH